MEMSPLPSPKSLDLWGLSLRNLPVLQDAKSITTVSAGFNQLTTLHGLPPNLTALFLSNNNIAFSELRPLRDLPLLNYLDLSRNPCSTEDPVLFEGAVLLLCPLLKKIGDKSVTPLMLEAAREVGSNPAFVALLTNPSPTKRDESLLKAITLLVEELDSNDSLRTLAQLLSERMR
jgi:Leucine-rich repeat (LRR) protein